MEWQKKYRWVRTWPGETGLDGKPHEDFVGYDGEERWLGLSEQFRAFR
jgi:hypothetical protein